MTPIIIKSAFAFEVGATFVFSSWLCIADGIGGFQRRIVEKHEKKHLGGNSRQHEVEDFIEKFEFFDLNKIGFDYNSN